jgi:raffinose/stachyose/melibiose transport system substrate-binding protein
MIFHRTKRISFRVTATTAIGVAALMAAGSTVPAASAQASGPSGSLKIITWVNPPAVQALTQIDNEFMKQYPNVKVTLETEANVTAGYVTLLATSVDSSSADIVTSTNEIQPLPLKPTRANMNPMQYWASSNVFLPLNGQPGLKNFNSAAVQTETYNGQIDGILSGVYQRVVFYNKTDFAKYHVSVPTTYSQFMTLLATLSADHVTPLWLGLGGGASIYAPDFVTMPLMASLWLPHAPGANIYTDLQTGSQKWDNPYFVQALTEEAAIAKYIEPDYTGVSWEGMPAAFAENKAPMLLDGSWDLATVQKANPSIKLGSFPLPGSNIASQNLPLVQPDLNLEVLRHGHDTANALKWMAFFASKPIYEQYVDITGISPSETSGTYTSFSSGVLGSWLGKGTQVATILPNPMPPVEGYYDTATEFPLLQEQVMAGSTTPQKAAQLIQSSWKP